jgi:hypothetical protein
VYESPSFALFLTWTCYGTWLPGDRRGYVSNTLLPERGFRRKVNRPGDSPASNDPYTEHLARVLQKGETSRLDMNLAEVAANSLVAAARLRSWRILRGALMVNHVHVVVADCIDDGPGVRRILKGNSQAALCEYWRETYHRDEPGGSPSPGGSTVSRRWWTSGGSNRYLHDEPSIEAAVRYVAEQEGMLVEIVDMVVRRLDGGATATPFVSLTAPRRVAPPG